MKSLVFAISLSLGLSLFASNPKYVFLFIGDGMSTPQRMTAEVFTEACGLGELAMNRLPYQTNTRTRSANAIVTDSAAAGTAIACGVKTHNCYLGVDAKGNRVESVAEVAKKKGLKVGIVTTVTVVHATPAAFYAHNTNRGASYQIGLDLIDSGFDYFAASGVYNEFDDRNDPKYRGNLFDLAAKAGYTVTRDDRAAWAALKPGGKVWSVFGNYGMDFAIDANPNEPKLAEMVAKGIELLNGPQGFFIMCEGGKVDYSAHANDAATTLRDVIALDDAVKVALDFEKKHPEETLIIVTGDHETGGMAMGFAGTGYSFHVEKLARQTISVEKYSNQIKARIKACGGQIAFDDVRAELAERFGLDNLTAEEEKTLRQAFDKDVDQVRRQVADTTKHDVARRYHFAQTAKNVLNARAGVGWSSGAHTALPTLTTAKGAGAEILVGMTENTDIGLRLKELLK